MTLCIKFKMWLSFNSKILPLGIYARETLITTQRECTPIVTTAQFIKKQIKLNMHQQNGLINNNGTDFGNQFSS